MIHQVDLWFVWILKVLNITTSKAWLYRWAPYEINEHSFLYLSALYYITVIEGTHPWLCIPCDVVIN